MDQRLTDEGHRHLSVPNIQVQRSRALPTQPLIEVEELLDMPPFGKLQRQGIHFLAIGGRQKSLVLPILWWFAAALDKLMVRPRLTAGQGAALLQGGEASPAARESVRRKGLQLPPPKDRARQRHQQVKSRP